MKPLIRSACCLQVHSQWFGFKPPHWKPDEYISFVWKVVLSSSLGFEVPVVILTLVKIGVVAL